VILQAVIREQMDGHQDVHCGHTSTGRAVHMKEEDRVGSKRRQEVKNGVKMVNRQQTTLKMTRYNHVR
jgi:hypothetical protein